MQTLREQGESFVYFGERGDWLLAAATAECADIVVRANFKAFVAALPEDAIAVEDFGGAFGYGSWLLIDPEREDAIEIAEAIKRDLEDYPVIDDEVLSTLEFEEALEAAALACDIDREHADEAAFFILEYDENHGHGVGYASEYWPTDEAVFFGYLHWRREHRNGDK